MLNPVRAGIVNDAGGWPWSSHRMLIGQQPAPAWLETDWLLGQFAATRRAAIAAYIDFVRAGVGLDGLWTQLRQQIYLGSDNFVERMQKRLPDGDLREIPRLQRRGPARPLAEYAKTGDEKQGMAEAYRSGHYTMQQIADYFGVHYSTVSRVVRRHEKQDA